MVSSGPIAWTASSVGAAWARSTAPTTRPRARRRDQAPAGVAVRPTRSYRARFRARGADRGRGCANTHIIPIHRFGEIDGRLFIDMRLVDGEDLGKVLAREGVLDPRRARGHRRRSSPRRSTPPTQANLIHRDIKPANVLLADHAPRHGTRCTSSTSASRATARRAPALTVTGAAVGTPDYMAPERFTAGRIDRRADIYALGCHAATRCSRATNAVHGRATTPRCCSSTSTPQPPQPSAAVFACPAALDPVVARSMSKNPE